MNTKALSLVVLALVLSGCGGPDTAPSHSVDADDEQEDPKHGGQQENLVTLTPAQVRSAGIEVARAGHAAIKEKLPVYGVIAPNAERVRDVGARFPGVIRSVTKKVGDEVRQGEPLAHVESNESLQTYAVIAPLNGVVTARNAHPGEQTGEKVLFTIADLSTVSVELSLFPRDMAKVRVGQTATVTSSDTGQSADGKIVYVAPFGTHANQTLTARVQLDNAARRWAPGLYVTAEITLSESAVPLAVRSDALQTLDADTVVFVQNASGFEPRPVRVGRSDGQWVELTGGLTAGETYAAANSFIVKAELGKGSAEHDH